MKSLPRRWMAWEAFRAVLIACLILASLTSSAQAPPNPAPDNAADHYLAAAKMFVEVEGVSEEAADVAKQGWAGEHPNLEDALAKNANALAELRKGLAAPYCSMPASEFYTSPPLDAVALRALARLILAEGRLYESRGEYENAYRNFSDVVKFGHDLPKDGVLINGLVGAAIENLAFDTIKRSLQNPASGADVYAGAARRLEDLEATEPHIADSFRREMESSERTVLRIVAHARDRLMQDIADELLRRPTDFLLGPLKGAMIWMQESGQFGPALLWSIYPPHTQTMLANLKMYTETAVLRAGKPYPQAVHIRLAVPDDPLSKIMLPDLESVQFVHVARGVRAEGTRGILALAAYKKINGRYPASLEAVVLVGGPSRPDAALTRMPLDLFEDKPLSYKPVGDGFVLYSVGPDMADDRAERECPENLDAASKGDIVFRLNR